MRMLSNRPRSRFRDAGVAAGRLAVSLILIAILVAAAAAQKRPKLRDEFTFGPLPPIYIKTKPLAKPVKYFMVLPKMTDCTCKRVTNAYSDKDGEMLDAILDRNCPIHWKYFKILEDNRKRKRASGQSPKPSFDPNAG